MLKEDICCEQVILPTLIPYLDDYSHSVSMYGARNYLRRQFGIRCQVSTLLDEHRGPPSKLIGSVYYFQIGDLNLWAAKRLQESLRLAGRKATKTRH